MRLPLRWKITIAFALLTAVVFVVLGFYLHSIMRSQSIAMISSRLISEARLAVGILPDNLREPAAELQSLLVDLDKRSGCRFTLIAGDGSVLADSRHPPEAMESHADRPERLQALSEGSGSAVRHSATLGTDMLYVAVVLSHEHADSAVLRLSVPLIEVSAATAEVSRLLLLAFAFAAAMVWLVSLWLANSLTDPVRRLAHVAQRVAGGDLNARAQGITGVELGSLAQVFNSTVERLSELLAASQHESKYYAAILEQMSDAVIVIDQQRRVQFVNRAFAHIFEINPDDVVGMYLDEVVLNYELSSLLTRSITHSAPQRSEVRLLHPAPRTLVGVTAPLFGQDGTVLGAVGLLHDVTDLHRAEQVRRDFVANASHELRTPAAGIKALAEVLQDGALDDPDKGPEFVGQIVETANRLTSILDDMLTLTRVERGQELLRPEWVRVAAAIDRAVTQMQPAASTGGVAIETEFDEDDKVYVDEASLQTVLINLLDNAIKYTPAGGRVSVTGVAVPGGYEIRVADTGVGVPKEHIPRIFERFYRVDKARDRATGGTGLGLAIVKHIAEAHGGAVTVTSTVREGSIFRVSFPNERPSESATAQ